MPAAFTLQRGWLVPVGTRDDVAFCLLLCSDTPPMPSAAELPLLATVGRASFALLCPGRSPAARTALRDCLHELRNGLNSVLMSAAIVAGPKLPDELRIFAADLQDGTQRSLRALTELSLLLRE